MSAKTIFSGRLSTATRRSTKWPPATSTDSFHCPPSIVDLVRREIARRNLTDSTVTLVQIAEKLGYSETSVLTRSCHRWFDRSPLSRCANNRWPLEQSIAKSSKGGTSSSSSLLGLTHSATTSRAFHELQGRVCPRREISPPKRHIDTKRRP